MVYLGWAHTRGAGVSAAPTKAMRLAMETTGGRPVLAMVYTECGPARERMVTPVSEHVTRDGLSFATVRAVVEMPLEPAVAAEMAQTWGRRIGYVVDWYTVDIRRQRLYRWSGEGHVEAA